LQQAVFCKILNVSTLMAASWPGSTKPMSGRDHASISKSALGWHDQHEHLRRRHDATNGVHRELLTMPSIGAVSFCRLVRCSPLMTSCSILRPSPRLGEALDRPRSYSGHGFVRVSTRTEIEHRPHWTGSAGQEFLCFPR